MANKHLHWLFIANSGKEENGNWKEAMEITVVGNSSEEIAREAAKNIISRPYYFLLKVWECTTCAFQEKYLQSLKSIHE